MDAVEGYGGLITRCEPTVDARESTAAQIQNETGATLVPPYNYGPTICGQGTMALEFLEQVLSCKQSSSVNILFCSSGSKMGPSLLDA